MRPASDMGTIGSNKVMVLGPSRVNCMAGVCPESPRQMDFACPQEQHDCRSRQPRQCPFDRSNKREGSMKRWIKTIRLIWVGS